MGKFIEDHKDERSATPIVIEWVKRTMKLQDIKETDKTVQKTMDADFYAKTEYGELYLFENKIRFKEYTDILIETISNMKTLSPGWIYKSKAHYLNYVFCINKEVIKGYIFDLPCLQEWWEREGKITKYPVRYGKTSDLYKTQNVAVPEKHIPLDCVVYHPNYGLINPPLGGEIDPRYLR